MESITEITKNIKEENIKEQIISLGKFIKASVKEDIAAHEVESKIWGFLLKFGRKVFKEYLLMCGDGDVGDEVELPDGRCLKRLEEKHSREYLSIFGEFKLERTVYGTGEKKKIEYIPLDKRLQLPEGKFSYLLQDWDQSLVVEMPYSKVDSTIGKILELSQSVDSLERTNRKLSESVKSFWECLSAPLNEEEGELIVCSADGKGVPIRKKSEKSDNPIQISSIDKKEKNGAKKMSLVGGVYSVDRYIRSPEDVLKAFFPEGKSKDHSPRPIAKHKRIRTSLIRDENGKSAPSYDEIFGWMADEVQVRNPGKEKDMILLMDGQKTLWDAGDDYLSNYKPIEILDIIHAASYMWTATHIFYKPESKKAECFAKERISQILYGQIDTVIQGIKRMGRSRKLRGKKLKEIEKICGYFENNRHRMKYNEYLAAGYPIATGVIEGACKNVVKDRMERSGMRWVLYGAQSMLGLRSISLCGLWDDFIKFHVQKETNYLYHTQPFNEDECQLPVMC